MYLSPLKQPAMSKTISFTPEQFERALSEAVYSRATFTDPKIERYGDRVQITAKGFFCDMPLEDWEKAVKKATAS
jgi:hypothetical protein